MIHFSRVAVQPYASEIFDLIDEDGDIDPYFAAYRAHMQTKGYALATQKKYLQTAACFLDYLVEAGVYGRLTTVSRLNQAIDNYIRIRLNPDAIRRLQPRENDDFAFENWAPAVVEKKLNDIDSQAWLADVLARIADIARRAGALRATFMDAPKQFEAYKADAIEALEAFEPGKTLDRATAAHDFDFARLKHEPHTVYLITPSERLGVIAPWISLIVNYAIEAIARERGPLTTTFILDEFPQLPPAPAIMKALRLYAGRGVQLWFFSQGRYSMEARWSKEAVKEIEDQASIFTMTGVEDPDLMRDVEKWSGNRTIVTHGQNVGGGAVESSGRNRGESRRAVLQSEDIRAIGAGKQIIKVAGLPTLIACDRVPFYTVDPWKDQIRDVREMHKGNSRKS